MFIINKWQKKIIYWYGMRELDGDEMLRIDGRIENRKVWGLVDESGGGDRVREGLNQRRLSAARGRRTDRRG